jgi:hypothetical protein
MPQYELGPFARADALERVADHRFAFLLYGVGKLASMPTL